MSDEILLFELAAFIVGLSIAIWFLLIPASIAKRKGSSWLGFFILSVFGMWLIALIWAYFILEDRSFGDTDNL